MPYILAHRGYLINGDPENSIQAFQTAIHYMADGLEFDIHLTMDRKFVCFHDDTLQKLGRSESIKDLSIDELTSIEIGEDITIPSLDEILEIFGNEILLNIELKTEKDGAKELVDILNQYSIEKTPNKLIISSFSPIVLEKIKKYDSSITTGLLCDFARGKIEIARKIGCDAIHPFYGLVPQDYSKIPYWISKKLHKYYAHKCFTQAKKFNILANPFGVNDVEFLKEAFKRNVFAIITDEIEKALHIRKLIR